MNLLNKLSARAPRGKKDFLKRQIDIASKGILRLEELSDEEYSALKNGELIDLRETEEGKKAILKSQELLFKTWAKETERDDLWESLCRMSWQELRRELFGDGLSPALDDLQKLSHYIIFSTRYSSVPFSSSAAKKKRRGIHWKLEILRAYVYHRRLCPTAHWVPTGAMEALMREMNDIPRGRRNIGLFGGNGCGKSAFWFNALVLGFLLPRPVNPWVEAWWLRKNVSLWANFAGDHGKLAFALMLPSSAIDTVLFPMLRKWAPYGSWEACSRGRNRETYIQFKDGGQLFLLTPNQVQNQLAGGTFDAVITTENFEERKLGELRQRLRGRGFMFHDIMPDYDKEGMRLSATLAEMKDEEKIVVNWNKDTACKLCGIRGFKEHSEVERSKNDCPSYQRAARVEGRELHSTGKCLSSFDLKVHVLSRDEGIAMIRDLGATLGMGCDPHEAKPNMLVWVARLSNGVDIIVDEYPRWNPEVKPILSEDWKVQALQDNMMPFHRMQKDWVDDPQKFLWLIRRKESELILTLCGGTGKYHLELPKVNPCVLFRNMDPHLANTPSITGKGKTYLQNLNRLGMPLGIRFSGIQPKGGLKDRYNYLNMRLSGLNFTEGENPDLIRKSPQLFILEHCKNVIHCFANIYYEPEIIRGSYTGQLSDRPDRDLTHSIDAADYILRFPGFQYIPTREIDPKFFCKDLPELVGFSHYEKREVPLREEAWRIL